MRLGRRTVRYLAVGIGLAYLLAAGIVLSVQASEMLLIYLGVAGLLVLGSVFSMRQPSAPKGDENQGYWQMTGERFRDPATGRTMEIRHNPVTGERDYVEVPSAPETGPG